MQKKLKDTEYRNITNNEFLQGDRRRFQQNQMVGAPINRLGSVIYEILERDPE